MYFSNVDLKEAIPAREAILLTAAKNAEANRDAAEEKSADHYQRVTEGFTAPSDAEVAKIARWESHVSRQMSVAMAELQRLQARRGLADAGPLSACER